MICDICHKNKATIIYTEVINGEKTQRCFCDECAAIVNSKVGGKNNKTEIPMGSILSGILSSYMERYIESRTPDNHNEAVCPTCGMTFSSFMKERLLGCPDCYSTFSMVIEKQLKAVQPGTYHVGKTPSNPGVFERDEKEKIPGTRKKSTTKKNADARTAKKNANAADDARSLKEQLKQAVEAEDYMLAAKLRDKIKGLENEKKDNKVVHEKKRS